VAGRRSGRSSSVRWGLLALALACGLGLLVLPAGAAPTASTDVTIVVDESVSSADGSTASPPAPVESAEPVGTADAVTVSPPAGVPSDEGVTVADAVSVVPPATILDEETVSSSDAPSVVPPAVVATAESASVSDDVAVVPTSSPSTTTVTAGPNAALVGSAVQLQATVTAAGHPVGSGSVTFEDGSTPLGAPVPVDSSGHASLGVTTLGVGSHTIVAAYGGSAAFDASSGMTSEGVYDYALSAGSDQSVLRGGAATFGLTLSLAAGSATNGLPSSIPFSAALLPPDATSNAPSSIAFPQSEAAPTHLDVTVQTGAITLGDTTVAFTAGARTASAGLHVSDFALSLSPSTQTVQAGDAAGFTLTSTVVAGSSASALGTFTVLDQTSTPVGTLAVPGSLAVTVPTTAATAPGLHTLTLTTDPGHRSANATYYVNVPPVPNAGGPYTVNEGSPLILHGSATDTAGETLTYSWDLGGGLTATGATPTVTFPDGPATRTATLTVCDDHGACASATTTITVVNVAPTARILSPADGAVFRAHSPVTLDGSFTDPGVLDTHTAVWTVGGTTIPATISEHGGSGTASAFWTPAAAGFYPLSLTVTDKDGGTATVSGGTLVVFDPSAGFVTGAGWLLDSAHGLVVFAFEARYFDGEATPRGDVGLGIPHLVLDDTHLDWLVVTPPSFALQGEARVGRTGGYRFRLDGTTGHPDQLRVRVWAPGGTLVYDSTLRSLAFGGVQIHR